MADPAGMQPKELLSAISACFPPDWSQYESFQTVAICGIYKKCVGKKQLPPITFRVSKPAMSPRLYEPVFRHYGELPWLKYTEEGGEHGGSRGIKVRRLIDSLVGFVEGSQDAQLLLPFIEHWALLIAIYHAHMNGKTDYLRNRLKKARIHSPMENYWKVRTRAVSTLMHPQLRYWIFQYFAWPLFSFRTVFSGPPFDLVFAKQSLLMDALFRAVYTPPDMTADMVYLKMSGVRKLSLFEVTRMWNAHIKPRMKEEPVDELAQRGRGREGAGEAAAAQRTTGAAAQRSTAALHYASPADVHLRHHLLRSWRG